MISHATNMAQLRKHPRFVHGHAANGASPTYRSWHGMIQRCENPNSSHFHGYGGRGIAVCKRWKTFSNFLSDMGTRPDGLTIERIDNDGNYEPGNCRWATKYEQCLNQRRTCWVNYMGQRKSVAQWCNELGLSQSTVRNRIFRGNTAEVIFSPTKLPKGTYLELGGKRANLSEWAKITGISAENISNRLAWGWPVRKALTQSVSQDHWAGKTHCANGHRLVPENIKVRTRRGQQHRECKQCRSERKKRARQAKAV